MADVKDILAKVQELNSCPVWAKKEIDDAPECLNHLEVALTNKSIFRKFFKKIEECGNAKLSKKMTKFCVSFQKKYGFSLIDGGAVDNINKATKVA